MKICLKCDRPSNRQKYMFFQNSKIFTSFSKFRNIPKNTIDQVLDKNTSFSKIPLYSIKCVFFLSFSKLWKYPKNTIVQVIDKNTSFSKIPLYSIKCDFFSKFFKSMKIPLKCDRPSHRQKYKFLKNSLIFHKMRFFF